LGLAVDLEQYKDNCGIVLTSFKAMTAGGIDASKIVDMFL